MYIYDMKIVKKTEPQSLKGTLVNISSQFFLRKLGEFDPSKTRSPGRKPEGKAGESGRHPGRLFEHITFPSPELVPNVTLL